MTLTLELPPEVESNLLILAANSGQDIQSLASALLAKAATPVNGVAAKVPRPSLEEFEAAMDELSAGSESRRRITAEELESALRELAAIGSDLPPSSDPDIFSRANIYADHD